MITHESQFRLHWKLPVGEKTGAIYFQRDKHGVWIHSGGETTEYLLTHHTDSEVIVQFMTNDQRTRGWHDAT